MDAETRRRLLTWMTPVRPLARLLLRGVYAAARLGRRGADQLVGVDWARLSPAFLPFADAATKELPLGRLLRLALFQVSVGMAVVLLNGTLNRVMIVELNVPAWLVSLMVALPLVFAPLRALIGFKSDMHVSVLGWRRVPYLWFGTILQFGGFAIMPFALLLLSGDTTGPAWVSYAGAALAFLLVGAGLHTVQTAGLALATDIAPEASRPRVVALLYVMLLLGMVASALVFSWLLESFHQLRLIQVVQGAAVATMAINLVALWKQEPRNPTLTAKERPRPSFREAWARFEAGGPVRRVLLAVGLGAAAFSMQDILLEPYGGEILNLGVGETTLLTALLAGGTLLGFAAAARGLARGGDPYRLAALGALAGVPGFSMVVFAAPLESAMLFRAGAAVIGFGGGLFSVGTLTAAMALSRGEGGGSADAGLALGAWGAVQATAAGAGILLGGILRDAVAALSASGALGEALSEPAVAYSVVYHLEILLLFFTLIVIGPLARFAGRRDRRADGRRERFGLAEFPG